MNNGIAKQHKSDSTTSVQNNTCTKRTNSDDRGAETYINIIVIVSKPIGTAPLLSNTSPNGNTRKGIERDAAASIR